MTNPEILKIVKQMLADWEASYDSKDAKKVHKLNCECGFCFYLDCSELEVNKMLIIKELQRDLVRLKPLYSSWYSTFNLTDSFRSLSHRINHLKRTIARLEKEIANENTAS